MLSILCYGKCSTGCDWYWLFVIDGGAECRLKSFVTLYHLHGVSEKISTTFWKIWFLRFCVLSGNEEASVRWSAKINQRFIAPFLDNRPLFLAKMTKILQHLLELRILLGLFFRHSVVYQHQSTVSDFYCRHKSTTVMWVKRKTFSTASQIVRTLRKTVRWHFIWSRASERSSHK